MGKKKRDVSQSNVLELVWEKLCWHEEAVTDLLEMLEIIEQSVSKSIESCDEKQILRDGSDKDKDCVISLELLRVLLDDAFALNESMKDAPTYEKSLLFAYDTMTVMHIYTELGFKLFDKTRLLGKAVIAGRVTGGKNTAKLKTPEHVEWLKEELKNHEGQKAKFKEISNSLFNKYGYIVGARTVRDRCKEHGLLKTVSAFPGKR